MGSGIRGYGKGTISAAIAAAAAVLALAAPSAASAAGETFYAAPGEHVAAPCTQASPCEVGDAVEKAKDGDSVQLAEGSYKMPFTGLKIDHEISLGGLPGERPVLEPATIPANVQVTSGADAALHDMRIEGAARLLLESGSGERMIVDSTASGVVVEESAACNLSNAVMLRNSVCWSHEAGGGKGNSTTDALGLVLGGGGVHSTAVLRNVTAYAATAAGEAVVAQSFNGADYTVDAKNVIAHAEHGLDVVAQSDAETSVQTKLQVNLANSSFATIEHEAGLTEVTAPGSAGNSSAPPTFLDASEGDFREAVDSPTLDLGTIDALVTQSDIDGNARSQPKCLGDGASPLPDAGAYERRPTAKCPPPAPQPPPPPDPRKPTFRLLKLTLDKANGRGSVTMEVPGAGVALLTGSGIKFVTRKVSASGTVTMPILPWAISRVRLSKNGKVAVQLKLGFEATGGGKSGLNRRITLRKSIR